MCETRWTYFYSKCGHTGVLVTEDKECKTPGSPDCKTRKRGAMRPGNCPRCERRSKSTEIPYPSESSGLRGGGGETTKKSKSDSGSRPLGLFTGLVTSPKKPLVTSPMKTKSDSGPRPLGLFTGLVTSPKKTKAPESGKSSTPGKSRHVGASPAPKTHRHSHGSPRKHRTRQPQTQAEEPSDESISGSDSDGEFPPGTLVHTVNTNWAYDRYVRPLEGAHTADSDVEHDGSVDDGQSADEAYANDENAAKDPPASAPAAQASQS